MLGEVNVAEYEVITDQADVEAAAAALAAGIAGRDRGRREDGWALRVHGVGVVLVRLGVVDLRVRGRVDDDVVPGHRRGDGGLVGDVEVGS